MAAYYIAVGAQGTFNFIPLMLSPIYGSTPFSAEIYLRVIPQLMK
ncbi:MAG: hypothetical protein QM734_03865 [Cyclobacteriaceae bacterium]